MITVITIFSWLLFAVALKMKAYANRIRFMAPHEMPHAFSRSPGFWGKLFLARLVLTYGSLIGVWLAHGMGVQVGAFLFYLVFCCFTFIRGHERWVKKWAQIDFERQRREAAESKVKFDEEVAQFKASKWAKDAAEENLKRNGNL